MADDLLSQLDMYIAFCLTLIVVAAVWSYSVLPVVMPDETHKTPFWHFFFGTSCLRFVRRPGDKKMTVDDLPDSGGTPAHNIEDLTAALESFWTPADEQRLFRKLLWHLVPWWSYSTCLFAFCRLMNFIAMSYLLPCVFALVNREALSFDTPIVKTMILGFLIACGSACVDNWCKVTLALKGTDPVYCGLALMIVRKLQRLSNRGMLQTNSAEAQQIAQESYFIAISTWATPLQTCIIDSILGLFTLYKLYHQIGARGIMICTVSIASLMGAGSVCDTLRAAVDQKSFEATVKRQAILNVVLDNFRELKLYGWVRRATRLLEVGRKELQSYALRSGMYAALGRVFTSHIDGIMTVATCFTTVFVKGEQVDFQYVMTARAYMGTLLMVTGSLSACRWSWFDMVQRADRIERFLRLPEVRQDICEGPLRVSGASFAWPVAPSAQEDMKGADAVEGAKAVGSLVEEATVRDVDLQLAEGELALVCGNVGSGKSSLLQALMGEMDCIAGQRWVPASPIAYQPQVPYLLDGTIRENVLFGIRDENCNEKHLKEALVSAQLAVDIDNPGNTLHAKGELTAVGKRGTHLSGGQRARTALARSVYAVLEGASVALLDDPVASVDNEVVQAAWDGAVLGAMKGITRVVAVNSQLLERLAHTADRLVVMSEGRIVYNGPPAEAMKDPEVLNKALAGKYELAQRGVKKDEVWKWMKAGVAAIKDFAPFFGNPSEGDIFTQEHLALVQKSSPTPLTFQGLAEQGLIKQAVEETAKAQKLMPAAPQAAELEDEADGEDPAATLADMMRDLQPLRDFLSCQIPLGEKPDKVLAAADAPLKLSSDEWEKLRLQLRRLERQYRHEPRGTANLTTLQTILYFINCSAGLFVVCSGIAIANSFKDATVMATISRWSERTEGNLSDRAYMLALVGVFAGFALMEVLHGIVETFGSLKISMHLMGRIDKTLESLGMPFFWRKKQEAEPLIRKVVNENLPQLSGIARLPLACLEALVLIGITGFQAPMLWLVMPVSAVGYYWLSFLLDWRNLQLWPVREQLQNTTWAKVVEMFDILPSIRGLKRQKEFQRTVYKGIMVIVFTNMMNFQMEVLLGFYQHIVGAAFNAVAFVMIVQMRSQGADAPYAYAFWLLASQFSGRIQGIASMYMPTREMFQRYRQMEDLFCSDTIETDSGNDPPSGWPSEGRIEFENVTFRYVAYLPPAWKDVSLVVQPAEKVGVVGKTGSGKSTLLSLLLRLGPLKGVAPSSGGRILVDGVDVATLRLAGLRSKIAVVPQEPTLFAMTLKDNIGVEFTDAEVLTALQWCGLDARQIAGKEDGPVADALATELRPGGLSVGQQQLLMAARALVRRPKILVLDECTASLDKESADRLLEILSTHSKDATVLAIAHRLRFVLNSDRILVLAGGQVIAFDSPAKLMEQPDSYFAKNLRYEQQQEHSE
mmetsp:Transcript_27719/g.76321  ORF Transcript_27719/g.76321 Transcript_27719/m.76321 type:complete len:1436 (-) Transcript_27719:320-4627(-)